MIPRLKGVHFFLLYVGSASNCKDGSKDGAYLGSLCNAYFFCTNNIQSEELLCPSGMLFNSGIGACDQPENVACPMEDYQG